MKIDAKILRGSVVKPTSTEKDISLSEEISKCSLHLWLLRHVYIINCLSRKSYWLNLTNPYTPVQVKWIPLLLVHSVSRNRTHLLKLYIQNDRLSCMLCQVAVKVLASSFADKIRNIVILYVIKLIISYSTLLGFE